MKRLFSIILLMFFSAFFYAQQGTEIPNFTPPSPEAYAITQYGNQEINESTGKAALSIPIHTYTVGGISIPIGLSYVGSGVTVNAPNTWTGVNWTLNAGGVITRMVQDDPDEMVQQRITQADINALGLVDYGHAESEPDPSNNAAVLQQYFNSPNWDTQPDVFSFSFPGGSGSFYLDENFEPVLITNDTPLKIQIEGNLSNQNNLIQFKKFKITTADGSMYYFGGTEVEQSKMEYGWHNNTQPLADTAYYLYRIEHPINGNVFFEYHDNINYKTSVSAMHSAQDYLHNYAAGGNPFPAGYCSSRSATGKLPADAPQIVFNNIYNAKFLKRIYTNANSNQEVRFNSTTTVDGGFNFERVLESIEIVNNTTVLKTIDLKYIFDYEGLYANRFFLTTVDFNDDKRYRFTYNNPLDLPARFSYAQDHYGYYNGADNNTGLLPNAPHPLDPSLLHPISAYSDNANRSFNFDKSVYGSLQQIIYPTGGRTTFEYESHQKKKTTKKTIGLKTFRNNFPIDDSGAYANDNLLASVTIGGNSLSDIDLGGNPQTGTANTLLYDQEIEFNFAIHALSFPGHQARTYIRVFDAVTNVQLAQTFRVFSSPNTPNGPISLQETITFPITFQKNKTYRIELALPNAPTGPAMHASLNFNFVNGEELVNAGSLRVKKQYDQTAAGAEATNIKRYYYLPKEDVFKNPIDIVGYFQEPSYVKPTNLLILYMANQNCDDYLSAGIVGHRGAILESSATNIANEQVLNNYKKVTISYGGDNFENGGVEKQFLSELGNITTIFKTPRIETPQFQGLSNTNKNASWRFLRNGKPTKETVLIYKNGGLYKIKENTTSYTNTIVATTEGFVGSFFADIGPGYAMPYTNVGLGKFQIHSKKVFVNKTVNIDYIDAVSVVRPAGGNPYTYRGWEIADHDNDGIANHEDQDYLDLIDSYTPSPTIEETQARKVITTTNYEYNSDYSGLPTKTIVTTSTDNKTYETVNRYVDERIAIANGNTNQLTNYNVLHESNRVGTPIQTESYVNKNDTSVLLSTQKIVYNNVNTSGKVLPSIIQASKGNNSLEDRVVFVNYDAKGNPSEIQYKDGSITKYIYNALNQVIQKIENYQAPIENFNSNTSDLTTLCQNAETAYPNSYITLYFYDSTTNLLIHIIDPSCNKMSYEYDAFYRLKYVKDKDGNILSKNEYNYTQN